MGEEIKAADPFEVFLKTKDPTKVVELAETDAWKDQDKIPGFETLTFAIAGLYELTWGMIPELLAAKDKYFNATLVSTIDGIHLVRGFQRREWAELQKEIITESEARGKVLSEGGASERWAQRDIDLHTEEKIALVASVVPKYDKMNIRSLSAGVVTVLANAAVAACGFDTKNQLPPLKL